MGSFNIGGANLDTEFDNTYNKVDNLTCPEGLSFNTSSSHNGADNNINNKRIINCIKRINDNHYTVCITATDICDENESKSINNIWIPRPNLTPKTRSNYYDKSKSSTKLCIVKYCDATKYNKKVRNMKGEHWKLYGVSKSGLQHFVSNFGRVKTIHPRSGNESLKSLCHVS